MENKKKTLSDYRLKKAKEDLHTAKIMLENQKPAQSVNRSYYAIFHAVRALLAFDLFDSKRHSSIIGYFNQQYIASGYRDSAFFPGNKINNHCADIGSMLQVNFKYNIKDGSLLIVAIM